MRYDRQSATSEYTVQKRSSNSGKWYKEVRFMIDTRIFKVNQNCFINNLHLEQWWWRYSWR